jgi:hypothetical protein
MSNLRLVSYGENDSMVVIVLLEPLTASIAVVVVPFLGHIEHLGGFLPVGN